MKKYLLKLVLFLISVPVFSQPVGKPNISQPPTNANAAKRTEILMANKVNIPFVVSTADTTLFPAITSVAPKPKFERYHLQDFRKFQDTASLTYSQERNQFMPRTPSPFQIRFGFDANKGDRSAPL
ncbi:MAG TPA: hypothetical protein VFF27_18920, partial [Bacteroidia bacterium]|nr:hypothetical protein [Bacteroidia bacterium]